MISKTSLLQKERISREDNQPIKLHLNTLYCMWLTETLLTEAIWFWFWQCTLCIQWHGNAYTKCMVSLFPALFTARTSEACHRPMTHHRAYRLINSMTNNVVSLFTTPFTAHTIVRRVTDQ